MSEYYEMEINEMNIDDEQKIWEWKDSLYFSIENKRKWLNIYRSNILILSLAKEKENK